MQSCAVLIMAAGGSSRMEGQDKLLTLLNGVKVLRRSIDVFFNCPAITEIVVVAPQERFDQIWQRGTVHPKLVHRVDGGAERQDSVLAGLNAIRSSPAYVAVHDGARPLVTPAQVMRCFKAARSAGAAALAHRVVDTLKRVDEKGFSLPSTVSRENLWCMETPQIFERALLCAAYDTVTALGLKVTDEVSALESIKVPTLLVENVEPNLKITYPQDLRNAEALINSSFFHCI